MTDDELRSERLDGIALVGGRGTAICGEDPPSAAGNMGTVASISRGGLRSSP